MNLSKKQNIKVWWVIPSSGILIGLNAPGFGTEWVGFISLIPLVWLLEKTFLNPNLSQKKKLFLSLLFCWLSAGIGSSIGAYWITHSAHVFGHLPWFGAVSVTFIGYGLEVGLLLWIALAGPLVILRHGLQWGLSLRILWFVVVDSNAPRLIDWNFGGLTLNGFPWVEQAADLVGSSGLSLFMISTNLLIAAWFAPEHTKINIPMLKSLSILSLIHI